MSSLRALLIQRAARLQEWSALTAREWGTLRYPAFRNRVEGAALGIMAGAPETGARYFCATGGPWDWVCEVACACCGLVWDPAGCTVDPAILGGDRFNDEEGRQAYHDRDHDLAPETPFTGGLTHQDLFQRLQRLNGRLGWDHTSQVILPLAELGTPGGRGALWSALYAGSHVVLESSTTRTPDLAPFQGLLSVL